MRRHGLRIVRVAVAAVIFTALTAALVDFRGLMPARAVHWLAAVQFTPALMALGAGLSAGLALVAILGVTLALGRVYCSTVCPLGVLQDVLARIFAWLRPRRRPLPFRSENAWLRYGVLAAVVIAIAGAPSVAFTHADPYSNFGRIASGLVRPLVVVANNLLVGPARALGLESLYRVPPPWPGPSLLAAAVPMLVLLAGLVAWRERIFCNTLCPVGTVLGLLARRAAWRLTWDRSACTKCAECLRACKAQCIDLRVGTIDASRCVACFNCVGVCPENGLRYRWTWWRRPVAPGSPSGSTGERATDGADPGRRAFVTTAAAALTLAAGAGARLAATAAGTSPRAGADSTGEKAAAARLPPNFSAAICPPGAGSVDRFLERCTACQLCVSSCPTHVLQPSALDYGFAGLFKPHLEYAGAFCNFDCRRCAEACPDGAIELLPLAEKQVTRIGAAELDLDRCIVKTQGTDCAACSEHCPTKAVDTVPYGGNLRLPQVTPELCIGCGACQYACPALPRKAITVVGRRRHERARRKIEEKARDPRRRGDFPF